MAVSSRKRSPWLCLALTPPSPGGRRGIGHYPPPMLLDVCSPPAYNHPISSCLGNAGPMAAGGPPHDHIAPVWMCLPVPPMAPGSLAASRMLQPCGGDRPTAYRTYIVGNAGGDRC